MNRRQVLAWAGGGLVAAGVLWPGRAEALSGRSGESRPGHRADSFPFPLPAAGAEIPCSGYAANVPLKLGTGVVRLDFKGGIRFRVETSNSDGLRLSVIGFRMTATDPVLGTVTMEQADTGLTPPSVLYKSGTDSPQMLVFLIFTLAVSNPPGGGGPLTLSTLEPARLLATNVTRFPADNQAYHLQAPVPLGAPGSDPDHALAVLQGFPLILSQVA